MTTTSSQNIVLSLCHENSSIRILKNGAILSTSSWQTAAFGWRRKKPPIFSSDYVNQDWLSNQIFIPDYVNWDLYLWKCCPLYHVSHSELKQKTNLQPFQLDIPTTSSSHIGMEFPHYILYQKNIDVCHKPTSNIFLATVPTYLSN